VSSFAANPAITAPLDGRRGCIVTAIQRRGTVSDVRERWDIVGFAFTLPRVLSCGIVHFVVSGYGLVSYAHNVGRGGIV
jgi:hypothetical protein